MKAVTIIVLNEVKDNYALLEPSYGKNQMNVLANPIFSATHWCYYPNVSQIIQSDNSKNSLH